MFLNERDGIYPAGSCPGTPQHAGGRRGGNPLRVTVVASGWTLGYDNYKQDFLCRCSLTLRFPACPASSHQIPKSLHYCPAALPSHGDPSTHPGRGRRALCTGGAQRCMVGPSEEQGAEGAGGKKKGFCGTDCCGVMASALSRHLLVTPSVSSTAGHIPPAPQGLVRGIPTGISSLACTSLPTPVPQQHWHRGKAEPEREPEPVGESAGKEQMRSSQHFLAGNNFLCSVVSGQM